LCICRPIILVIHRELRQCLFDSFIIDIKRAHWFFLISFGLSVEIVFECLVIKFQFVFNPFLFELKLLGVHFFYCPHGYFMLIKLQSLHCFFKFLWCFDFYPIIFRISNLLILNFIFIDKIIIKNRFGISLHWES